MEYTLREMPTNGFKHFPMCIHVAANIHFLKMVGQCLPNADITCIKVFSEFHMKYFFHFLMQKLLIRIYTYCELDQFRHLSTISSDSYSNMRSIYSLYFRLDHVEISPVSHDM